MSVLSKRTAELKNTQENSPFSCGLDKTHMAIDMAHREIHHFLVG
jgi:hypothetical protein